MKISKSTTSYLYQDDIEYNGVNELVPNVLYRCTKYNGPDCIGVDGNDFLAVSCGYNGSNPILLISMNNGRCSVLHPDWYKFMVFRRLNNDFYITISNKHV